MEFVSPTKWPNLVIKEGGFQFGLGTLRDAELRDQNQVLLEALVQNCLQGAQNGGDMWGQHWAQHETTWGWIRSGVWCLGMKHTYPRHFGKVVASIINRIGHKGWKRRSVEGDPELGRPSSVRGEAVSVLLVGPAPSAPKAVPGTGGGRQQQWLKE